MTHEEDATNVTRKDLLLLLAGVRIVEVKHDNHVVELKALAADGSVIMSSPVVETMDVEYDRGVTRTRSMVPEGFVESFEIQVAHKVFGPKLKPKKKKK